MSRKHWGTIGIVLVGVTLVFLPALYARKIIVDATREFDRIRGMFDA